VGPERERGEGGDGGRAADLRSVSTSLQPYSGHRREQQLAFIDLIASNASSGVETFCHLTECLMHR
jgi:hypothetical protein